LSKKPFSACCAQAVGEIALSGPFSAENGNPAGIAPNSSPNLATPGLLRRLAAIFYDWLLLIGVMIVASLPIVWLMGGAPSTGVAHATFRLYLLAIAFAFFAWFWTHGGQTLGMRVWRLRLVSANGGPVSWGQASRRFLAAFVSLACLGLGFLWILHDHERRAWHDRLSGTHLQLLPKRGGHR
jgi:uncharacterized RDD family membrane protein YckC